MKFRSLISIVAGAVVGMFIDYTLGDAMKAQGWDTEIFAPIRVSDVVMLAIGFMLAWFGGRIHPFVRFMGYGWIAYMAAREICEAWGRC